MRRWLDGKPWAGRQKATMLSLLSRPDGISTSSTAPGPNRPSVPPSARAPLVLILEVLEVRRIRERAPARIPSRLGREGRYLQLVGLESCLKIDSPELDSIARPSESWTSGR